MDTKQYYPCCGKSICGGCLHSFCKSGNMEKCPFCKAEVMKSGEDQLEELRKWVEANHAGAMCQLGCYYHKGGVGLLQDRAKAIELCTHSSKLGSSQAHCYLGNESHEGGDLKMAKFHYEAAAMAGHEVARVNLGNMEFELVKIEQTLKHFRIAASTGDYNAMHNLRKSSEQGLVSRDAMDSTLTAYNNSCAEMRSEARDAFILWCINCVGVLERCGRDGGRGGN